jgi:hypothetical protein
MTIAYPLPTNTFFETLFLQDSVLLVDRIDESASRLASGDFITKNLGPSVWRADFFTVALPDEYAIDIQAQINSLRGSEKTFFAYNVRRPYPKNDPTGSILGAATVQIKAIHADSIALQFKGLPAGYVLSRGDFLAFDYGINRRRAYHQLLEGGTADGSGETSYLEVEPTIRAGAVINDIVTLKKAAVMMCIVPGSVKLSSENIWSRLTFQGIQVTQGADPIISPSPFVDTDVFYSPTVTPAAANLTPALFSPGDVFFSPTVSATKLLVASHFADTDVFFPPSVVLGGILPNLYVETDTFFTPTVTQP